MAEHSVWGLVLLGLITCSLLAYIIYRQLRNLSSLRKAREQLEQKKNASKQLDVQDSLLVLAGSVLDGQVEVSEACMRIKILLDHLNPKLHETKPYSVFNKVYLRLESMPRFEQRQAVDKRLLAKLDQTRFRVEQEFESEVFEAAKALQVMLGKSAA